jgi:hypothetical protein
MRSSNVIGSTENGTRKGVAEMAELRTPVDVRAEILSDLFMDYQDDPDFKTFIERNNLGLPLAYAVATEIVAMNDRIAGYVNDTFETLLAALGIEEDKGFEELGELFIFASE